MNIDPIEQEDMLGTMRHGHACPVADKHYAWAVAEIDRLRKRLDRPVKMLVDDNWLRSHVAADPDIDCEVATPSTLTTAPVTLRDVRLVLKEHWLTEIKCEHQSRSDQAICWCGWTSAWYPSVGEALNVWIYHVCEHLAVPNGHHGGSDV